MNDSGSTMTKAKIKHSSVILSHYSPVTPHGDRSSWWYQAITWTNAYLLSKVCPQGLLMNLIWNMRLEIKRLKPLAHLPRVSGSKRPNSSLAALTQPSLAEFGRFEPARLG